MLIIEILIYVVFALIMVKLGSEANNPLRDDNKDNIYLICYIVFYTIICAIRFNVGVDCLSYITIFKYGIITASRAEEEMIWTWLVKTISGLGIHPSIGLGICAFIQILFITLAVKKQKFLLAVIPVVLFGGRYFLDMNAAVRQMMGACIFLWSVKFIVDREPLKYFCWIFVASLFHHSALILLPFYFVANIFQIADRRKLMMGIFLCCFIAGQTPAFNNLMEYAVTLTSISGYDNYEERVSMYLMQGETKEALSFGPMMLSYFLTAAFIIWFGPQLKQKYEDSIPLFNVWYNLAFFYGCAYFLVANISHIFIRPVMYFSLFQMLLASLLLYDFWEQRYESLRMKHFAILFCVIIWVNISWDITKNYTNPRNPSTYKVFFMR